MSDLQDFATRCERSVASLEAVQGVYLERRTPARLNNVDDATVNANVAARVGGYLGSMLEPYLFSAFELHASWEFPDPRIIGEFCLSNLQQSLTGEHRPLEDSSLPGNAQSILGQLKVIDQAPFSGSGRITGARIPPGTQGMEVWFYDMKKAHLELLDLDYRAYLENVLLTRGAFGWQYLFAEVDLREGKFRSIARNLDAMLGAFSEHFPEEDYAPLRARLEARL